MSGKLAPAWVLASLCLATTAFGDPPAPVPSTPVNPANPECAAQHIASGGTAQCAVTSSGKFCDSVESCKTFCCCACTTSLDGAWWSERSPYDGRTTCPRSPTSGDGIMAPDSGDLHDLGTLLTATEVPWLSDYSGKRATQAVADGLKALNDQLAALPDQAKKKLKVRVGSCYRRAVGNSLTPTAGDGNAEAVCGMVYKMLRVENSPRSDQATKDAWHEHAANVWQMAWPGYTPHAGGIACDLVLVDGSGSDCFDVAAGDASGAHCSLGDRASSELMDKLVGATGGWRLDFEAWHYEWGGAHDCRCQGDGCKRFYPPTGHQRCS